MKPLVTFAAGSMFLSALAIPLTIDRDPPPEPGDPVIQEWTVPWEASRPRDPYVDRQGIVWFVGQRADYVASLDPETGEFERYDLEEDRKSVV